jgi:serine/threonine protein kinase/WD40 repeat protein
MIGTKLAHYEITSHLGTGGMGEVYQATDLKLGRSVAIKLLPEAFAQDEERVARFEREARVLASLNHPNIAAIYGVEESVGRKFLVMELVDGETLAERIKHGAIPLDESLGIATQITEALEAAHEKGIIHRDLKPANVKVTPDGRVKVLDFGLAKALETPTASASLTNSPTLSIAATQTGVILGTAGYMSPEQARGKPVSKSADIWAFGVVLYEMLNGRPPFQGEDVSQTMASVIMQEPEFEGIPNSVQRLLKNCLEKDPKKRLRDIGDVWRLLEPETSALGTAATTPSSRTWLSVAGWVGGGMLAILLASLSFIHFREVPPSPPVLQYTVGVPDSSFLHSFAISPDGRLLVIAAFANGKQQLWLRPLDALQAQAMPFTEGATFPFWSPDNHWIGFFAQGRLKKVSAGGGPAQSLCDAPNSRGGSWNRDNVIVFTGPNGGIGMKRVPASGGDPADINNGKGDYRYPTFLPDGRHFLYLESNALEGKGGLYVSSLDGKENRRVLSDISGGVFAPAAQGERFGHILFIREGNLMAQPFDEESTQVAGDVVPVADGINFSYFTGSYAPVTVSGNGVLLFAGGGGTGFGLTQIAWYDRSGKPVGPMGASGEVLYPAISPDEKTIAFQRKSTRAGSDLWLRDLNRETDIRFTADVSANASPVWSPNGDRIVFASNRKGGIYNLYQKTTSGSGQDELLLETGNTKFPTQWSKDGRFIVYMEGDGKGKVHTWVLQIDGSVASGPQKPVPFLHSEFNEEFGQLSPDSRWMAYTSDESGRREVYVRPFPAAEGRWKISVAGGQKPRWRGDGKEIFFEAADGKMTEVMVKPVIGAKSSFERSTPQALFDAHMVRGERDVLYEYDVAADGQRFLVNTANAAYGQALTVVVNWNAGLKKK